MGPDPATPEISGMVDSGDDHIAYFVQQCLKGDFWDSRTDPRLLFFPRLCSS